MHNPKPALLILEDSTQFKGLSFGYDGPASGVIGFSTTTTGYPGSLTNSSYEGLNLVMPYHFLGKYGVAPRHKKDNVSEYYNDNRIRCQANIARDYSRRHSLWQADNIQILPWEEY